MPKTPYMILAACLLALNLSTCQSHEKTADDAFERVREGKMNAVDAQPIVTAPLPSLPSLPGKAKLQPKDPWTQFTDVMKAKIASNAKQIVALKGLPNNGKSIKKVMALEKENNDLHLAIETYHNEEIARWDEFEARMQLDVEGIATALQELKPLAQ